MLLKLGAVAIGRNEGERLRRCLSSLQGSFNEVVYVDSGSTDDSVDIASQLGAHVVHLSMAEGFTAARARNEGYKVLSELLKNLDFVQFIDGDCELIQGWTKQAVEHLLAHHPVAIVCGKCEERYPDKNVYHRLAEMEWQAIPGDVNACGGNFMIRATAFREVRGFTSNVIAAEDDDLCVRLRQAGWRIVRLDCGMVLHDASIDRFTQWWRRMVRTGHGFAQVYLLNRHNGLGHFRREFLRTIAWGACIPLFALALAIPTAGLSIVLAACMYCISGLRSYNHRRRIGNAARDSVLYALWITLSKFPSAVGILSYCLRRTPQIIEYKTAIPR